MERSSLSRDPTDRLIRELIQTRRDATPEEIDRILLRIAIAPFLEEVRVPSEYRGVAYRGRTLGHKADSLFFHLVERVKQGQWAESTSEEEFLEDLRRASYDPTARLVVYERRGGNVALVFAENRVPESRRGEASLDRIVVVYSADRGRLVSGYQASSLEEVSIPEHPLWLR